MAKSNVGLKDKLVNAILKNPTYAANSGLVLRLYDRLMAMSKDDLENLKLLIDLKVQDAADAAGTRQFEWDCEMWARENPGAVMRSEDEERERQLRAGEI